MNILITGGTGHLGRATVQAVLQKKTDDQHIIITTRNPDESKDLAEQGVTVKQADYNDKNSMISAFRGVNKVLLISGFGTNQERIKQHHNAISAALMAGVRHILYTSFANAEELSYFEAAEVHRDTEAFIKKSGLTFTIFRNALYADLFLEGIDQVFASGKFFAAAGEGKINSIPRAEIAEATATVLTEDGHGNTVYNLTGPETFTYEQAIDALSEAFGKPVRYVDMNLDEVRSFYAQGDPDSFEMNMMVSSYKAMQAGEYDFVSDDFEKIVKRKPMTTQEFFKQQASSEHRS